MTHSAILVESLVRWLGLVALAVLVGGLVVDLAVLPRNTAGSASSRARLGRWTAIAVVVLVLTSVGDLIGRARVMSGGDLAQATAALPLVLTRTHFGAIWITRGVALAVLLRLAASRAVPARVASLGLSLVIVLTSSLTGHAADFGDWSLSVLVDWLHGVAATTWTGGLFALVLTICRDRTTWPPEPLRVAVRKFSRLAGYCLLVVVVSGIYNSVVQVPSLASLWETTYGTALLLKIALALALACLGAINRYRVLPRLGADHASARLARLVAGEALIAVVVFGCTAVLAESTPKGHEGHGQHAAARLY
jgi:putative copper resistance protein D